VAVTKIWAVHSRLKHTMDYAMNPEKTVAPEGEDLEDVLAYATDGGKTERQLFVSGINCDPVNAVREFNIVKQQYGKTEGVLAYHGYMSFAPGEVTPEQAHRIGVEAAEKIWGGRYQVVVTTHLNTNCLHNHFVINSLSYLDGKKMQKEKAWFLNRKTMDEICKSHSLSVVENPERNPDSKYLLMKDAEGKPTRYNVARLAIDEAINKSRTIREFSLELRRMGYTYKLSDNLKYWTVTPKGWKKPIRLYRLGEEYTNERIRERLSQNRDKIYLEEFQSKDRLVKVRVKHKPKRRIGRLKGLYLYYCYQLGAFPKHRTNYARLHYLLKEELMRLDEITAQVRFMGRRHIETEEDLHRTAAEIEEKMKALLEERKVLRNEIRKPFNQERLSELKREVSQKTSQLAVLRKEKRLCEAIAERSKIMRGNLEQISKEQEAEKRKEMKRDEWCRQ